MSFRLPPHQRAVLDRLERGEIDADEAERILMGAVEPSATDAEPAKDPDVSPDETPVTETDNETPVTETDEEAKARELVERLARDIYGDEVPPG